MSFGVKKIEEMSHQEIPSPQSKYAPPKREERENRKEKKETQTDVDESSKISKYRYIRKIKPSVLSAKMRFDSTLLSPTTFSTTKKGDKEESVEEENVRIPSRLSKRLRPTSLRKRFQYRDDLKVQLDEGTQRKRLTSQDGIGEKKPSIFEEELEEGVKKVPKNRMRGFSKEFRNKTFFVRGRE